MNNFRRSLFAFAAVACLGVASTAQAAWTFPKYNTVVVSSDVATAPLSSYAADGNAGESTASLSVAGAYVANGSGNVGVASGAAWSQFVPAVNPNSTTSAAQLLNYSGGLGMASDGNGDPNHAIDNNGTTESVVLQFSSSVTLTQIGLGYISNGSLTAGTGVCSASTVNCSVNVDLSVWRYVGTTAPTSAATALAGTGASLALMNAAGWDLVGNYGDVTSDITSPYYSLNNTTKGSSWWLVSAYNSAWSASTNASGSSIANVSSLDQGNDYFKLYAVAGTACSSTGAGNACGNPVPEPSSLALVTLAGLGLVWTRRRPKQGAAA